MAEKKEKQEKNDLQSRGGYALKKVNLVLMAISFCLIVVGFLLMLGGSSELEFNPDIFSFRRITVGPMISLLGFLFMVFAILYKGKGGED